MAVWLDFKETPEGPHPEAAWFTNTHNINLYCGRRLPAGGAPPRCVAIWIHGIDDHGARWSHVADALSASPEIQAACYLPDWQGHGRSSGRDNVQGLIVNIESVAEDVLTVLRSASSAHPGLPVFLCGHSLGGLICINLLTRDPEVADLVSGGLVLSSPALAPHQQDDHWIQWNVVVPLVKHVVEPVWPSFPSPVPLGTELTHDEENQEADKADPLRGLTPRAWTMACAGLELKRLQEPGVLEKISLPWVLLGSPADNLVGSDAFDQFERRSATPAEQRARHSFPGLWHELLRERQPDRQKVLGALTSWAAERVKKAVPRSRIGIWSI